MNFPFTHFTKIKMKKKSKFTYQNRETISIILDRLAKASFWASCKRNNLIAETVNKKHRAHQIHAELNELFWYGFTRNQSSCKGIGRLTTEKKHFLMMRTCKPSWLEKSHPTKNPVLTITVTTGSHIIIYGRRKWNKSVLLWKEVCCRLSSSRLHFLS